MVTREVIFMGKGSGVQFGLVLGTSVESMLGIYSVNIIK